MIMRKVLALTVTTLFALFVFTGSACPLSASSPPERCGLEQLSGRLFTDLPHPLSEKGIAAVQFFVTESGHVIFPKISQSSGDLSIDFAVLESICALSPLSDLPAELTGKFELPAIEIRIDSKKASFVNPAFCKLVGLSSKEVFAYHKIPLSVLYRYPGLFTDQELRAAENLELLENDERDAESDFEMSKHRLFAHYESWSAFFSRNKVASRDKIVEFSKGI